MSDSNYWMIGHGDAGEAGRIVDVGGGTAGLARHTVKGGQRGAVTPATAALGIEAGLAALGPWGGDLHLHGDGVTEWDLKDGTGPGIVISKPGTRIWFHNVRLKCTTGTRAFVVRAQRSGFLFPHFRSTAHSQAAFYVIRYEESVASGWDCSGAFVIGGRFELGNGSSDQAAIGAIVAAGDGTQMQGLTVALCEFIGVSGTQQTTATHPSATFRGVVPISLSKVSGALIIGNVFRGERATPDATLTGYLTACVWLKDTLYCQVIGNVLQGFQPAASDGTRGPGVRLERISTAEGHHTVVGLNNMESAGVEGFLDTLGAQWDLLIGNLMGRNLGSSYAVRARADSQTGANGDHVMLFANGAHNTDEDLVLIEAADDVLIVGLHGSLMHSGKKLVRVDPDCRGVHHDEAASSRQFKNNPT